MARRPRGSTGFRRSRLAACWIGLGLGMVAAHPVLATYPRIDRGVYVVGQAMAAPRGALGIAVNPASLAVLDRFELRLQSSLGGSSTMASRGQGWGGFGGLPLGGGGVGLSFEAAPGPLPGAGRNAGWLDPGRITAAGALTLDGWLHVGVAARLHPGATPAGSMWTTDVGLLLNPWSWLSIGATVTDLLGASTYALAEGTAAILGPQYGWGWALRVWGGRLEWAIDLGWPNAAPTTRLSSVVRARLGDAVELGLEYHRTLHHLGITGQPDGADGRVALVLSYGAGAWSAGLGGLRDDPQSARSAVGLIAEFAFRRALDPPLSERLAAAFRRSADHRARAPARPLSDAEIRDWRQRARLGWVGKLHGKRHREARAIARGVLAFSAALAEERREEICTRLADTEPRSAPIGIADSARGFPTCLPTSMNRHRGHAPDHRSDIGMPLPQDLELTAASPAACETSLARTSTTIGATFVAVHAPGGTRPRGTGQPSRQVVDRPGGRSPPGSVSRLDTCLTGPLRFDIETTDPTLVIHRNMDRRAACASLRGGVLGRYVHDFGPSHPHADVATLIPALFAIHGSAYLHLPAVQLDAYAARVRVGGDRARRLRCDRYQVSRIPRAAGDLPNVRRYDVEIRCAGVAQYRLEMQGNRRTGFFVRKFTLHH